MPNWCHNHITISGDKEVLKKLKNKEVDGEYQEIEIPESRKKVI